MGRARERGGKIKEAREIVLQKFGASSKLEEARSCMSIHWCPSFGCRNCRPETASSPSWHPLWILQEVIEPASVRNNTQESKMDQMHKGLVEMGKIPQEYCNFTIWCRKPIDHRKRNLKRSTRGAFQSEVTSPTRGFEAGSPSESPSGSHIQVRLLSHR